MTSPEHRRTARKSCAAQGHARPRQARQRFAHGAHGSTPPASASRNQCTRDSNRPASVRNNLRGHRALRRAKQRPAMAQQLRNTTGHRALSSCIHSRQVAQPARISIATGRATCAAIARPARYRARSCARGGGAAMRGGVDAGAKIFVSILKNLKLDTIKQQLY
ncbi:hypothetical protein F511_46217 [Dorcoceras hygrometricum]|uniref:Uncharacterized protein n=1 Tax=Dorcoceras hygrometricum TaxID=472368 RepID=A0A2Z7A109_9LAMI|nr:hypothetical protein F511_46217 [Dorcoceras hygrometricum]